MLKTRDVRLSPIIGGFPCIGLQDKVVGVAALPRQKVVGAKTSRSPTRRSLCLELDNTTTKAPHQTPSPSVLSFTRTPHFQ
jgi:hypothetical protein